MPPLELPVALRYWPELFEEHGKRGRRSRWFGRSSHVGERVIVFDTETTADDLQRLRFGFWRLYAGHICEREGVFIADDLRDTDPDGCKTVHQFAKRFGLK